MLTLLLLTGVLWPGAALAQGEGAPIPEPTTDEDAPEPPAAIATEPEATLAAPREGRGVEVAGWIFRLYGRVRAQLSFIENDTKQTDFVGLNDGFVLGSARLGLEARQDDVTVVISLEGAVDQRNETNTSTGEIVTRLKDGYIDYNPFRWLAARVGQFKPPFDGEEQISTGDLFLIHRSLPSRGVKGVEGINIEGLSVDRQVGAMLYSEPIFFGESDFGVAWYLDVTNGTGANRPLNDNESMAYFGRLELLSGRPDGPKDLPRVRLGGGMFYNEITTGRPPDLLTENHTGLAGDLTCEWFGAVLATGFVQRTVEITEVAGEPERVARGWHVLAAYHAPYGLVPAYRYGWYDPTAKFEAEDPVIDAQLNVDTVRHHTLGLGWEVPRKPLKLQVNYTIAQEDADRSIDNNRLEALVQAVF